MEIFDSWNPITLSILFFAGAFFGVAFGEFFNRP